MVRSFCENTDEALGRHAYFDFSVDDRQALRFGVGPGIRNLHEGAGSRGWQAGDDGLAGRRVIYDMDGALSPGRIDKGRDIDVVLVHRRGMEKESAGVDASCMRLKKRWVGRSGPSEP